ncbi:MAG: MaoC family dehydratase N-terminal domain-containing protein [Rudaea sp.]
MTPAPIAALSATLDRDDPLPRDGDALPPLWHWLYFLPHYRQSEVGPDGHAKRGGFLPPVPLPRRMWGGGRLQFAQPLHVGEAIERESRIIDVVPKEGRSGPLVFVVVRHTIRGEKGPAIVEEHDIVYRGAAQGNRGQTRISPDGSRQSAPHGPKFESDPNYPAPAAPPDAAWSREIHPDPVLLFRYSALTFNAHRIHYDRRYVMETEGYPGLVVHGPLIATLLTDLLRRECSEARIAAFSFRALSPLFDIATFLVCGTPAEDGKTIRLWAANRERGLAMDATARLP